jgi:F-box-like
MRTLSNLPNELLLQILVEASSSSANLLAISYTCKQFRSLLKENEQSLSKKIAAQHLTLPYRVLGFAQNVPSISNLLLLAKWTTEIMAFANWCQRIRDLQLRQDFAPLRAIWSIPLWQEHLQVGLLLYKMLSLSTCIREKLEQLPGRFHALLRFTSIMVSDLARIGLGGTLGKVAIMRIRQHLQSGFAPGDMAPWLRGDSDWGWRSMELVLFEQGCKPFLEACSRANGDEPDRDPPRLDTRLELLKSGQLPPDRNYHLRLDELCLAHGRAWGPASFWWNFDPFRLQEKGLRGLDAVREMLRHLPA